MKPTTNGFERNVLSRGRNRELSTRGRAVVLSNLHRLAGSGSSQEEEDAETAPGTESSTPIAFDDEVAASASSPRHKATSTMCTTATILMFHRILGCAHVMAAEPRTSTSTRLYRPVKVIQCQSIGRHFVARSFFSLIGVPSSEIRFKLKVNLGKVNLG